MKLEFKENDEQKTCANFMEETSSKFTIGTSNKGASFNKNSSKIKYNYIIFVLDGEIEVGVDNVKRKITKGEFCFVPISSVFSGTTIKKTKYIVFGFLYSSFSLGNRQMLSTYQQGFDTKKMRFDKYEVRTPLNQFLSLLVSLSEIGCEEEQLFESKCNELFVILRAAYTREEIVRIFYPIMGQKGDFRAIVMDNYIAVQSRHELADLTDMSVSSFSRKFKEEFGEPVYSWMLKQRGKRIYQMLSVPSVSVGDIVKEFKFSSPSHLTKYCRKQFGCTPTELRHRIRLGYYTNNE